MTVTRVTPTHRAWRSVLRTTPGPGGGGTPLYGLYRYVRPQRVWFFSRFGHKLGIDFSHFAAILATYARYAEKLFTQIYRNSLKK